MNYTFGYCCIWLDSELKTPESMQINRTMRKDTFIKDKQSGYVETTSKIVHNLQGLKNIIQWNIDNNIKLYRMSSDMFPWNSEYLITDLPDFSSRIKPLLDEIGSLIRNNSIRVSMHPGHFVVIASLNPNTVQNSIKDLENHGIFMDLLGLDQSYEYPINIHVNLSSGDKSIIAQRFIDVYNQLSPSVRSRLVVENDDKKNGWSVQELYDLLHSKIGIPITFDYFHHECSGHIESMSIQDAESLAYSTWGRWIPLFHLSSSKKKYEDSESKATAHADVIHESIHHWIGIKKPLCVDIEAKHKNIAVFNLKD